MRNSKWLESYNKGLIFSHKIKLYFVLISVQELKKQQSQNVSEEEAALRIQKGMVLTQRYIFLQALSFQYLR